ncbi:hypothetical protein [Pseudoclavibacter helvolus]|uniref:hypothetical protein n=1 Tax=Pseudoclavibacter helvolus TaxID=255205 RepID=UPI0024AC8D43|nr:hypothetical protein [Pseudoclavibacter helvolus]
MGQKNKGDRVPIMARPLAPLAEAIKQTAKDAGLSYGDFLVTLAARELGMTEYAPKAEPPNRTQLAFEEEITTNAA